MSDEKKADLLRFANEYADQNVDLYDLLGVDALTPKEDIHRAWRKRSLKHHPDKAGADFDASKWELFERARDVLSDPPARAAYDQALKARLLRKQEREAMDKEHKQFADDLEAREGASRRARQQQDQRNREAVERERARLAEEQRMHEEEARRRVDAAQEMEDLAEARRRVRERKEEKARRREVKESMRATGATAAAGRMAGPANGVVEVPGEYVVDGEEEKRKYWELVCDKLRAVQAVRNLLKEEGADPVDVRRAEDGVVEARRRIYEAEMKFQREAAS